MDSWILEIAQMTIAGLVIAYIFYTLAFSAREEQRQEQADHMRRNFERREIERSDRRNRNLGPPRGHKERRMLARRGRS